MSMCYYCKSDIKDEDNLRVAFIDSKEIEMCSRCYVELYGVGQYDG